MAYRFQPLCHVFLYINPRPVPRGFTAITFYTHICSPLHKQLHHWQMTSLRRIMQRSAIPHIQRINLRSPVQQQTARIQLSIPRCIMQSGVAFNISTFYVSTALQQHPHHLHMAINTSICHRCITVLIICSAVVICILEQYLRSILFSVTNSQK